jgi:iron complex outermembrane recepter protein
VFFSNTPTYDPEELISYEIGYKSDWLDNPAAQRLVLLLRLRERAYRGAGSDHLGGLSNSVLAAPGGEVYGVEAEATWLVTDHLTLGGNFSYTPSEYSKSLLAPTCRRGAPDIAVPE